MSLALAETSPLIVRCSGYSIEPPHVFITMELCDSGCLFDALHSEGAAHPYTTRLELAHDVTSAVEHLHSVDVVHR